jgi:hypothetical protein
MSILRFVSVLNWLFEVCLKVIQIDPASGIIFVDGIDITSIGLHDLRSRVVSV